jgi:uncharacterized membrane protein YkoI
MVFQLCAAEPDFLDSHLASSTADNSQALVAPQAPAPAPKLNAAEAAEIVRQTLGGEVINVHTYSNSSGTIYAVKMLKTGRMKTIKVDGQNGRLLNH